MIVYHPKKTTKKQKTQDAQLNKLKFLIRLIGSFIRSYGRPVEDPAMFHINT